MRSSELVFLQGNWRTRPVTPSVGLRQGCSLGPLIFRWCVEDLAVASREQWTREGHGLPMDEELWQIVAWADDIYLFATGPNHRDRMVAVLRRLAHDMIGLVLRPEKCKWAAVQRREVPEHTSG